MKARATSTKISTGRINEAKAEDSGSAAFFEGTKQMIKTLLLLFNIPNQCSFISVEYAEAIIKCEEFERMEDDKTYYKNYNNISKPLLWITCIQLISAARYLQSI